ncbi:hypothetical protein BS50DRAFT_491560 [Corynespora cassiicola Philippines]|uniref:Uncharacterized protein n=1 Tax=Corynespora cassiicola Philippines TaxID=1448308 RepID=A0A2T2NRG4_CORCC|nr:hypothetical protein BS50DRAFT_491560 [Corynespora cassiicola Philippines]
MTRPAPAHPLTPPQSRIARSSNNRQSFPSAIYSPSPVHSTTSTAPSVSRIPASIDTKAATPYRRASALPTSSHLPTSARLLREQSPLSPAHPPDMSRSRLLDLSPKPSFSSTKTKDTDMSPREFLSQMGRRRPSHPDALQTPPNRTSTYRPSNLHYSSSRDTSKTPCPDTPQDTSSRMDGTESQSQNSTGPAASVWDELDDLKTRIRKIELGGKIPTTSGAAVAQASAERPRTANTSVTTVSSSPKQQRKANASPAESTVGAHTPQKVHPLLKEALAKARQHLSPAIYRVLEATASEALELAELTGSAGPQGTLQSASSVLAGASVPDRQVRRKADNICRSLTELCIAMCDPKSSLASPALRTTIATGSRRPSVQVNGESPSARQGIESDTSPLPRTSPSRALSRIEARRASMMAMSVNGSPREASQETPTPSQSQIPTRLVRAGTSFNRSRKTPEEDDEDLTLRAPSRALTDFRDTRQKSRANREYTSREPLPDLQPAPSIQPTVSLRRPTVTGSGNENHLLYRDGSRRYNIDRQNSPAYEKQVSTDLGSRMQYNPNRNSIGSISALDRSASIPRRYRGASVGE